MVVRHRPFALLVALCTLAAAGVASGCLTTMAPNIRARDYHRELTVRDADDECLICHEAELAAQRRLMAMTQERRQESMDWMMRDGGAALVAQWMIDDPRGCQGCHLLRGATP